MSAVRSWRNVCDGWGTPAPTPDWLNGREVGWSTRLRGYRVHFQAFDGQWVTAKPGDWIIIDAAGGLHRATDEEHGAVMGALIMQSTGAQQPAPEGPAQNAGPNGEQETP